LGLELHDGLARLVHFFYYTYRLAKAGVERLLIAAYLPPPLLVARLCFTSALVANHFFILFLRKPSTPSFPSMNFGNSEDGSLLPELLDFLFLLTLDEGQAFVLLGEDPMEVLGFLQSHIKGLAFIELESYELDQLNEELLGVAPDTFDATSSDMHLHLNPVFPK